MTSMRVGASPRRLAFVLPGNLDGLTGGTVYDRQIVAGLRQAGWQVDVVSLHTSFPWPDAQALADAASSIAQLPDGTLVVADGLAFSALPAIVQQHASRLQWVALVHHPLALETGLDALQRQQLFESERQALAAARAVIVTSAATARALANYAVPAAHIHVVEPGTSQATLAVGSGNQALGTDNMHAMHVGALSLLCVATLTPRKGHAVLLEALAGLQDRRWTLHCVGSMTRDAATTQRLRNLIAAHQLEQRVHLHGELGSEALHAHYAHADAFVLPSFHEGYGMALAEALAHGLPVISTTAGAIPDTVPAGAGVLVPPGDTAALRAALARLLDDPAWCATLATGARAARSHLADWPVVVERFTAALAAVLATVEHESTGKTAP